jgi:hypothetical protein
LESVRALLDAHRALARAAEADAETLEEAERALAAVERDGAGGWEEDERDSEKRGTVSELYAKCDALASALDRRADLARRARRAGERACVSRAEEHSRGMDA